MTKNIIVKKIKNGEWKGFYSIFKGDTPLTNKKFISYDAAWNYAQEIRKAIKLQYYQRFRW